MGEENRNTSVAFGDESIRKSHTPPLYLLAATVLPEGLGSNADALRKIMPKDLLFKVKG